MEKGRFTYEMLARYMAGECSDQEKGEIEEWTAGSMDNAQALEEFRHIWSISKERDRHSEEFDAVSGWGNLNRRLREEKEAGAAERRAVPGRVRTMSTSIHSTARQLMRFAAIFLLAGLIGFLAYQNFYQPESLAEEPVLRAIRTDKAQRVNLTLADGTKVLLNAESTIRLPVYFEPDIREVSLRGQAYFDVTPNPEKPFLIHVAGSSVHVLGTSFSIRSYPEDGQVLIAVKEGRVSFEADSAEEFQRTILTKGHLGRYDLETRKIESERPENIGLYLSWTEGYLRFEEASMSEVAVALERRYNIEVIFKSEAIKKMKLTAFLKSRSIRNVLTVITRSLHISYRFEEDRVIFSEQDKKLK